MVDRRNGCSQGGFEQYYTRARSNAYTDLKREHNAKSNPWVASGDADVTDHVQAGERKGRVPVVSVASVPEDPETAALTRLSGTVVGAIVSRAVLVMAGRARKPQLTDTDLTILAFLLELDHGLLALREEEAKQAHVFTEEKTWRQELAAQLDGMNEKKLSAAVGTILARVRVALYLFAQLAPPHGSVDDPDEMDRLFDVAYIDGHGLDATARMLLHKAGVEPAEQEEDGLSIHRVLSWPRGSRNVCGVRPMKASSLACMSPKVSTASRCPGRRTHPSSSVSFAAPHTAR
ncbi:MAG: hypothetical protein R2722_04780 [Tessaracoccus sp.]